jgi:membrane associated rhomboid family serine protease
MGPRHTHKRLPGATLSLIAINGLSYVAGFESARLPLYLFSHATTYHLLINMLVLWVFGSYLESRIGWKRLLIYYFLSALGSHMLWQVMDGRPLSGASGAVSGLMALFFHRCRSAKKKAIIPIRLIVVNLDIHAGWFLYYWLLWHVYSPLYVGYNATYVGGFVAGMVIGKTNRHRVKDRINDLFEKAVEFIDDYSGLAEAEQALLEAHELDPENPDVNLELGRYYSNSVDEKTRQQGKKFYLDAAREYYLGEKGKVIAADVFLEYFLRYAAPVEPETHLKYSAIMSYVCNHEGVIRNLEPLIETQDLKNRTGEKIFLVYMDSCLKAGFKERAEYAHEKFGKAFPGSPLLKEAEALMHTFEPAAKREMQLKLSPSADTWEEAAGSIVGDINAVTSDIKRTDLWESDLSFWLLLYILILVLLPLIPALLTVTSPFMIAVAIIGLPFVGVLMRRATMSFFGSIYAGRGPRSEAEGLREFNLSFFMDKARACEREGKFEEAITYLRGVLKEDGDNFYAQFQIARLYHKKLNMPSEAIREYKKALESAPEGHPFRRDAYEGIKELSQDSSRDNQPS